MAGATEMTMETLPMVLPRSELGTTVMIVVISSGIMMAVPEAWMMRAARSTSNPGARPASSVPSENSVIAEMNIERVVKRCSRNPVTGMTIAIVSMNDVDSHWAARASMPRSTCSVLIATLMIVSFRMTTKVATSSTQSTPRSRPAREARAASVWA